MTASKSARRADLAAALLLGACLVSMAGCARSGASGDAPPALAATEGIGTAGPSEAAAGAWIDRFDGLRLDARWEDAGGAAGAARVGEGGLVLDLDRGGRLALAAPLAPEGAQLWTICLCLEGDAAAAEVVAVLAPGGGPLAAVRASAAAAGDTFRFEGGGLAFDAAAGRFVAAGMAGPSLTFARGDHVVLGVEVDRARRGVRFFAWEAGVRLVVATPWAPLGDAGAAPLRLHLGGAGRGLLHVAWVRGAAGPRHHAFANGKDGPQGSYDIRPLRSYDGAVYVPDGERPALVPGPRGAWDDGDVKDPWVVRDGDGTLHLFYSGRRKQAAYAVGLASVERAGGPFVRGEAPIVAGAPGGEDEGIQFPAVVEDVASPDPTRRWQMLYDGYDRDAVHGIFLATAPALRGPWTRRGRVLGPGPSGAFDEMGCGGGLPLRIGDGFEVWYPGLRRAGDTGIWSIGRAVGASLDRLERDGAGARITQAAGGEAFVNGAVRGRFVPLSTTEGFEPECVISLAAEGGAWQATSRIREVREDGVALYHAVPAPEGRRVHARSWCRASLWPRALVQDGGGWALYATVFGAFRGHGAGVRVFEEGTAVLRHRGATPASDRFRFDWAATPPAARGYVNGAASCENLAFVVDPLSGR